MVDAAAAAVAAAEAAEAAVAAAAGGSEKGRSVISMVRAQIRISVMGVACGSLALSIACGKPDTTFPTPEAAIARLEELLGTDRVPEEVLGAGSRTLVTSGDAEADHEDALRVKAMIQESVEIEDYGDNAKIAFLGKDEWPLPFPLVEENGRWHFDVEAGRQELLNRRVGRNELLVLDTLHAILDAQREYFAESAGVEGGQAYAIKFNSTPGTRDGLYWPATSAETESPLGPFVATASIGDRDPRAEREPFRGYYFRMMTEQGPSAPGGARSYFGPDARLSRGFAVVAWPAKYGNSGIMTFQMNQSGIVFEKDLGAETPLIVSGITAYSPDESWDPTSDTSDTSD